jgi:hypothetical protein
MEGVYQSASAREADFQKLAQNTGTNIQKILQNGKPQNRYLNELNKPSAATRKHTKQLVLYYSTSHHKLWLQLATL